VVRGSLVKVLLHIFSWFWQWKAFENWSIFDEVIRRTKSMPNFWATLYDLYTVYWKRLSTAT